MFFIKIQITSRDNNIPEHKTKLGSEKTSNGPDVLPHCGGQTEGRVTPTVPQTHPITIGQVISLLSDARRLLELVGVLVQNSSHI